MKIKTSELTGAALDWAVAFCENQTLGTEQYNVIAPLEEEQVRYSPSTDWSQGGPIIEREGINLNLMQFDSPPYWTAHIRHTDKVRFGSFGPTPLIAAMRCYVASKLGEEVEIPDELIGE